MPKRRVIKKDVNLEQKIEAFGNLAEVSTTPLDFESLSLEDLARQYQEIDRQSHLLKGRIIWAARSKFASDKEFGKWLSDNLSDLNQKQAHRLACLAEFFDQKSKRSMTGISLSACYELSAPKNRTVAQQVYQDIAGKNYPLASIKEMLSSQLASEQKQLSSTTNSQPETIESTAENIATEDEPSQAFFNRDEEIHKLIYLTLAGLKNKEKLDFLSECITRCSSF